MQLVAYGSSSRKWLKVTQIHHIPMPIFPDYRKISCQKWKWNKSRYSQELPKNRRHSQKVFFLSEWFHRSKMKCEWTKSQIEYWKGIYTFFNKAGLNTGGQSNKSVPKTLWQETVLNKSEKFQMPRITCKYSKTIRNCSCSYNSKNQFQTWLVLLTLVPKLI